MKLKIAAIDNELGPLNILMRALEETLPNAEIKGFQRGSGLLAAVQDNSFLPDVLFLDIEMPGMSGLELAKRIKDIHGSANIVFVTGYKKYAMEALELYVSGYLLKPATPEKIRSAMENLRNPLPKPKDSKGVRVQCFGNFEIFVDGLPLRFVRVQTKELLALLVDRKGAAMNTEQICATLWEDDLDIEAQKNKLRHLASDLSKTLKNAHADNIFLKHRNSYAVVINSFECDYYDFLQGLPSGVNAYSGEYMSQYSWAEMTLGAIE